MPTSRLYRWRAYTACVLTVTSTACRTVTRVASQEVTPGRVVRVALNDRGTADVAALIGPRARTIEGSLVTQDSTHVTLAATSVVRAGGDEEPWRRERVTVARTGIESVGVPRLDRGRTALAVGGVIAGALVVAALLGGDGGVGGRTGGGSTNPR